MSLKAHSSLDVLTLRRKLSRESICLKCGSENIPKKEPDEMFTNELYRLKYLVHVIKVTYSATLGVLYDVWFAKYNKTELPPLPEKTVVITGGSRGIGIEIVRQLLQCEMEVIIACRHPKAGEETIKEIRDSGVTSGKAKVYVLDNSSLASVSNFVKKFQTEYDRLDILINNGVMFTPNTMTPDGYEPQYQINYLSHFLLTSLLLPQLFRGGCLSKNARIINVSSCIHWVGSINFADLNNGENDLTRFYGYAQSKLALLLFTKSLARLLADKRLPINVYAVNPGIVRTTILDHWYYRPLMWLKIFYKTKSAGATSVVFTAVNRNIEHQSGLYVDNCIEGKVKPCVNDLSMQDRLFNISMKQLSMTDFFQELISEDIH